MFVRPTLFLALASAAGCAAMMRSMEVKPHTADNPLVSGQPLEAREKGDVGVVSEQDCNIWPFEDTMSVRITDAQICISARKHRAASPGWSGEPTANRSEFFRVSNEVGEGGSISVDKQRSSKVAQCFNKGFNAETPIWLFEYEGCAPNNGTVTAATTRLTVGDETWEFPGSAPPAAASAGAPAPAGS